MADPRLELFAAAASRNKPLNIAQDAYNNALQRAGKKIWGGMLAVASSGFGKGVLITAAVVLGVIGMFAGYNYSIGNEAFEKGLQEGIAHGLRFLMHGFGLVTLAIGGALGAVSEVRKEQNRITAERARVEALEYETVRQLQQTNDLGATVAKPWEAQTTYAAREYLRRAYPSNREIM